MSATGTLGERLDALEAGQARIEAAQQRIETGLALLLGRLQAEQIEQGFNDLQDTQGAVRQLVEVYYNTQRDIRTLDSSIRLALAQIETPPPEGAPRVRPPRRQLTAVD